LPRARPRLVRDLLDQAPGIRQELKRGFDIVFSSLVFGPPFPVAAGDCHRHQAGFAGPVFYFSERAGKKGRAFRCFKFRAMVCDAERQRAGLMHRNEGAGVLFKIAGDPRVTRLGRFLRKHSLDELPQFFNVLRGDMSVVGPRPLLASDVRDSRLAYQRVLAVPPASPAYGRCRGVRIPPPAATSR